MTLQDLKEIFEIERTETLDLPTWEEAEIDELVKSGKSKNGCWNLIKGFTDKKNNEMFEFSLSSDDDNQFYLSVNNEDSSYKDLFYKPLTYENYLEACELCKKLFEGGGMSYKYWKQRRV